MLDLKHIRVKLSFETWLAPLE